MPNITVLLVLVIIVPTILYLEISASKKHFKKHFLKKHFPKNISSKKHFQKNISSPTSRNQKHFLTDFAQHKNISSPTSRNRLLAPPLLLVHGTFS